MLHDTGRNDTLVKLGVSRETTAALDAYVGFLSHWNAKTNLVGSSTLPNIWSRHILDCGQIMLHYPDGSGNWLDLGSGAGLPGLIVAILTRGQAKKVHLIESNAKKCAFLHHVARELDLNVEIHCSRIEVVLPALVDEVQVVTARALAPLSELLHLCEPLWRAQRTGLFFKGQHIGEELTEAAKSWKMSYSLIPSLVSHESCILRIDSASRL